MSDAERKAYARGYAAAGRRAWPAHRPPAPPEPVIAALMKALHDLRDAADSYRASLDEDDEIAKEFGPLVDAADEAMAKVTESLFAGEGAG